MTPQQDLLSDPSLIRVHPDYLLDASDQNSGFTMSNAFTVRFVQGTTEATINALASQYGAQLERVDVGLHPEEAPKHYFRLLPSAPMSVLDVANAFYLHPSTVWSVPDAYYDIVLEQVTEPDTTIADPLYSAQWHLNNTGQFGGTAGIDIRADSAWCLETSAKDVVVAVFDDGVEAHEDLGSAQLLPGFTAGNTGTGGYNSRTTGHGQAVTGLITAQFDSVGVRGVTEMTKIIPINIFPVAPASGSQIAAAMDTARARGADIFHNSWGIGTAGAYNDDIADALIDAMRFGRQGKGIPVIKSAGNTSSTFTTFPATVPGVIVVGGIRLDGTKTLSTPVPPTTAPPNEDVDLVAPTGPRYSSPPPTTVIGEYLRTTDIMGSGGAEPGYSGSEYIGPGDPNYMGFNGTSGAAPLVTGTVALMLAINPDLPARTHGVFPDSAVHRILFDNAEDQTTTATWDGNGLVNAYASMIAGVAGRPDVDVIAADRTFNSSTRYEGTTVYVLPGVRIEVDGNPVFTTDAAGNPSKLVLGGTLADSAAVDFLNGSELVLNGCSRIEEFTGTILADGSAQGGFYRSCVLFGRHARSTVLNGDIVVRNGGVFMAQAGRFTLGDGASVKVEPTADVSIEAGAEFRMGQGSDIIFDPQHLSLVGTASSPIRFLRSDPNKRWGDLEIRTDGAHLEHLVIDGGYRNLYVKGDDVLLEKVTSQNGVYGLYVSGSFGGLKKEVRLSRSLIANNTGTGVYGYFARFDVFDSEVNGNGGTGIYLYQSDTDGFAKAEVSGNGHSSSSPGVYVGPGGNLVASYYEDGARIFDNAGDQIYVASSGSASLGTSTATANHSIYGGSGERIDNRSSSTVIAEQSWWGTSVPKPFLFNGPVDYSPALTSEPGTGGGGGTVSLVDGAPKGLYRSKSADGALFPPTSARTGEALVRLQAARDSLESNPSAIQAATWAADAFWLTAELLREDHDGAQTEVVATVAVLNGAVAPLLGGPNPTGPRRTSAEAAAVALLQGAVGLAEAGDISWGDAASLARRFEGRLELPQSRVAFALHAATLAHGRGDIEGAMGALDEAEALEADLIAADSSYTGADYTALRNDLSTEAGEERRQSWVASPSSSLVAEIAAFELGAPVPNPSRARAVLPLVIARKASTTVDVYDVLGRRVANLYEGEAEPGVQRVAFDGARVAAGVYVIRAIIRPEGMEPLVFTQRVTVVK